ncbi:MAG: Gfo/Idh/MocA family oxidoreductase [Gemmataceae bacterium]
MTPFRCALLSAVKHDYVARGMMSHPRFVPAVIADDADQPEWAHARNQQLADEWKIPYVRDVERAVRDFGAEVAIVSSAAERHVDLSVRAAQAGLHIVQDKPMSTRLDECCRLVRAVERAGVRFLLWNRSRLPAIDHARDLLAQGHLGEVRAIHVDFYFAKDAGPPLGSRPAGAPPLNWLEHQIAAHADGSDGGLGHTPLGELQNEGIYPLGYIQRLLNASPRRVFARATAHFHQLYADNHVEDLATVSLEFADGLVGSLCIGRIGAASHPDLGEIKVHLVGSQGALVLNEARPEVAIYHRGLKQASKRFAHRRVALDNDYLLADDFARAIDEKRDTLLGVRAAWSISATLDAALRSARTGQPVAVPDFSPPTEVPHEGT